MYYIKKNKSVLFFLVTILHFFLINAQVIDKSQNDLKFKHFTSKDGLSQSSVITIFQDKKGYIWFGTRDGLNKFDGTKFTIYRSNYRDSTSLSHSWITSLFEDSNGNLWVGTKDGLNKYNRANDNFKQYFHSSKKNSITNNEIWGITQLDSSSIYISTSFGLNVFDIKNKRFSNFLHTINKKNSLSDNRTRGLLKTPDGNIWVLTIDFVDKYNPKKNSFSHYKYPIATNKELHINNAPTLFQEKDGTIWLGYEGGLAKLNNNTNSFENYELNGKKFEGSVRTIYEDKYNNLWVGTYSGLYIVNKKNKEIKKFVHNENDPKSLSQNSIYKIIEDTKGDLWIGTWAGGINYFDRNFDRFKQLSSGSKDNLLNYKVVSSIIEDANKNLWIGTEGGGMNVYDRTTGLISYHTKNNTNPNSISSNNIKSMIKDRDGNFWIGTHDGGLNFLNPKIKPYVFQHFDDNNLKSLNIKDYRIISLLEDVNRNLWIGTLTHGLIFYDRKTKTFTNLQKETKSIFCIVQSSNPNQLLVGGSLGLDKVDINSKKIISIDLKSNKNNSHLSKSVNCIYEDKSNHYWIGTEGHGLYSYNTKTKKIINYGIKEGLPNEIIYGILPDSIGHLWISTNYGLSKFNLKTNQFENYDESDGLQGNEFNYNSFLKTSKGELVFGGQNGLNYFLPKMITNTTYLPSLDIYAINVNNKHFLQVTDSIKEIKLKYNQNDFNIDFVALSFSQPSKINYAVKLEGFDEDWNYIGNKKNKTYTNIDEGTYEFKVKSSYGNGVWNPNEASVKIIVLPAPWYTWWAYLVYLILIATLIYYSRELILIRIQERNELKKEKLEKEKLEEVNKLKLEFFTNISHEFRTPLTLITGPVEQLLKQKTSDKFVKRNLDTIQRNTKILLQLINELLDFRKSEDGKFKLNASKDNLIPFIKNIKLSFEELARQKNIKYIFSTTNEEIEVWFDKIKMNKIISNLLSNAFKFSSDNNNLFLNISTVKESENYSDKEYVKIDIINFVKVIPEEHIKFIFERFYQLDQKDAELGTGIGLSLTKNLVELHKGKIEVNSSSDYGTCFSVFLPLGKEHLTEEECVDEYDETINNIIFNKESKKSRKVDFEPIENEIEIPEFNKLIPTLLIVEDNSDVRNFMKTVFGNQYNIYEAENGRDGIEMARKFPIDIIISDVMMPIMNGFELCNHIKTDVITSHIPVILVTAKTSDVHRDEGYKMGANAYIIKPFDPEILEIRVKNLLAIKSQLISKFKKDIILEPNELTITSTDELFLEKAIKIVEEKISDTEFNVIYFAEQMNMSRSVLFRKMKALTGQSINEFVRTIKIKRAGQLLASTSMSIADITYEVGFNDLKYFRKCFKITFDETPTNYRIKYGHNPILTDLNKEES